jgi:hypothetical protein
MMPLFDFVVGCLYNLGPVKREKKHCNALRFETELM